MNRTPGPWYADGGVIMPDGDTYQENGEIYARSGDWQEGVAQLVRNPADAAFIVTACNAHDDLVAALTETVRLLKRADMDMERGERINPTSIDSCLSRARAALAKVQS